MELTFLNSLLRYDFIHCIHSFCASLSLQLPPVLGDLPPEMFHCTCNREHQVNGHLAKLTGGRRSLTEWNWDLLSSTYVYSNCFRGLYFLIKYKTLCCCFARRSFYIVTHYITRSRMQTDAHKYTTQLQTKPVCGQRHRVHEAA